MLPINNQLLQIRTATESIRNGTSNCIEQATAVIESRLGTEAASTIMSTVSTQLREKMNDLSNKIEALSNLFPDGRSKLTDEKKMEIKRLVDAGASLSGITALHLAAAMYKEGDLFHLLIDEYSMDVEAYDDVGRKPIHVAACMKNLNAVRVLIAKGADKKSKNKEGDTALEEMNKDEMLRFAGGEDAVQIRRLLL